MLSETSFSAWSGVSFAAIRACAAATAASTATLLTSRTASCLGAGDLVLGELHAALEMVLHRFPRLGGERLRLLGGKGDDAVGLARGLALLAAIIGEHLLGLFPQAARLFQLLGDLRGARIEERGDLLVHAEIEQRAEKDEEGDGDPEFRRR